MSRSSPGVARVVAILNFMAEHPGQSFTLTDIVRALKLSRATCHALLAGLVEAGYLFRTSDKSYVLGPGLVAIGRIADQNFSPLRTAQPEMRALADEYDAVCSAVFREGDDIVVRERSASRSNLGWSVARGTRLPLKPPTGVIFWVWSPASEADAFLDAVMPDISAEYRADLHASMRFTREIGFQVAVRAREADQVSLTWLFDEPKVETPILVLSEIDEGARYPLASLTAPVFDAQRRIEFVLGLMGFPGEKSGADIVAMGRQLRASCDRITAFLAGRQPEHIGG